MLKNKGVAFKLILVFSTTSLAVMGMIGTFNYHYWLEILEKNVVENAGNLAKSTVNRIETIIVSTEKVADNFAGFIENGPLTEEELKRFLRTNVGENTEVYGSTVAFEPYAFKTSEEYFAPYFFKKNKELEYVFLGSDFRYQYRDWYQIPKELGRSYWSEPYYDEGAGEAMMSTYSAPFYERTPEGRKFRGVVTADISLDWLQETVSSIKILETGYAFLVSRTGTIVTHPIKEMIMNETIFSIAEARGDEGLRDIGRRMIQGASGIVPFTSMVTGKECWMYYEPVPSTGWSLAVLFPKDELLADITRLNKILTVVAMSGFLLLLLIMAFIARSITRPLRAMAKAAGVIATGDLDAKLPMVRSKDEVGQLADAFGRMKRSLKEHIKKLTEATAARERIESELNIARKIQMSILPKALSDSDLKGAGFDIHAVIHPAREVGGDFYDHHYIDSDRFCFVIGDVSGKGMPAALFMAVTAAFFKATVRTEQKPDEVLRIVNEELNLQGDQSLFVTVFFGILNTKTGEVLYANGGHNKLVVVRANGETLFLDSPEGMIIGVMENVHFKTGKCVMKQGDTLFMYTDGVTEAMNEKKELFTEERMMKALAQLHGSDTREIISALLKELKNFSGKAPQSDDITMMAVRYGVRGQ